MYVQKKNRSGTISVVVQRAIKPLFDLKRYFG